MKRLILLLSVFLFVGGQVAMAQMNRKSIKRNNRNMSNYRGKKSTFGKEKIYNAVGISLNALNYYGDLSPTPHRISTDLGFTRPAFGATYVHRFGPRYQLQGSFTYGTLRGADTQSAKQDDASSGVFRYDRNLSFRNRIEEVSVVGVFDLFQNQATYISRVKWTPYAFAGVGVFHHNPQAQVPKTDLSGNPFPNAGQWVDLEPLGTEGQYADLQTTDANYGIKPYKKIQMSIPMGIGVRLRINEVMDISGEFGFRYLFTDYIDDVSGNYVDLGVFGNNELAKALSYRSNELSSVSPNQSYVGRDGKTYNVLAGYGSEFPGNLRGNRNNRDIFTVTTVRLTYIIGKTFHRAKFR